MKLKHYWNSCNKREQYIISGGILCLCLIIIYFSIWVPLVQIEVKQQDMLVEQNKILHWLKHAHNTPQLPVNKNNLLSIMATEINVAALKPFPYQIKQTINGDVQINFERVAYRIFITWLWNVSQKYSITIQQLHVTKINTAGIVSVTLLVHS